MRPRNHALVMLAWCLMISWKHAESANAPIIILPGLLGSHLRANYTSGVPGWPLSAAPKTSAQLQTALTAAQSIPANATVLNVGTGGTVSTTVSSVAADAVRASGCVVPLDGIDVWLPDTMLASMAPNCSQFLMKMQYQAGRFRNNSDTEVWADASPDSGSGMSQSLYKLAGYDKLLEHIEATYKYKRGVDLFVLPYDFRQDLSTLEASGQLQQLRNFISRQVLYSGNQKAILIGHSLGAVVGLQLLQDPITRQQVKGVISLAAPYGGTSVAIPARISGSFDYLLPWLLQEMQNTFGDMGGAPLADVVRQYMYQLSSGMPSVGMLMPYYQAIGEKVMVTAGTGASRQTFNVSQISQLMAAIGDEALAEAIPQIHTIPELLRPLPNVKTFCIYGVNSDTPVSWKYSSNLKPGTANELPQVDVVGKGDGVVNLESLRLCSMVAGKSAGRLLELRGVTHFTVYQKRTALRAIQRVLDELLLQ